MISIYSVEVLPDGKYRFRHLLSVEELVDYLQVESLLCEAAADAYWLEGRRRTRFAMVFDKHLPKMQHRRVRIGFAKVDFNPATSTVTVRSLGFAAEYQNIRSEYRMLKGEDPEPPRLMPEGELFNPYTAPLHSDRLTTYIVKAHPAYARSWEEAERQAYYAHPRPRHYPLAGKTAYQRPRVRLDSGNGEK